VTALAGRLRHPYEIKSRPFGMDLTSTAGLQYRIDTPHLVLASATQRHVTSRTQDVTIVEQSFSPFLKFDLLAHDKVRLVTGIRGDIFSYDVREHVNTTVPTSTARSRGGGPTTRPTWSSALAATELFANFGTGFHSNDARAVIADRTLDALPTATGWELGSRAGSFPAPRSTATYWFSTWAASWSSSATRVRPRRRGGAIGRAWSSGPRSGSSTGSPSQETSLHDQAEIRRHRQAIPLAPIWTARGRPDRPPAVGLASSLEMRYLGDRPADPTALGGQGLHAVQLDDPLSLPRRRGVPEHREPHQHHWRESQFFFTSRLPGEPAGGVADLHFTPGNPRSFLGGVAFHF